MSGHVEWAVAVTSGAAMVSAEVIQDSYGSTNENDALVIEYRGGVLVVEGTRAELEEFARSLVEAVAT